ncbi:2-amino-4-hydroxy-6-hydroxymethyldihydropteridine diphosphokinase [Cryobacterium sp. TMT2-18-3]|uniref:2-amino-4-hydroxy-6- hydroxymethyldihydropteridine diphosphokinase n=1 Tax=unclassified Cryobacterium TaxID=2649013 RepID=UPI00106C9670|nr:MULTISPECIES: 2-amino-4-hydroxy-6-hydroxymethyldihydropteridine diphosphokinase [unclassified Cryobacterium]TFC30309.1 2-amino-4-hydroxy-6-hydroxymethyldihydropteridine diphosphokinase [Cryobacterium sp. TMT2-18-2]TFC40080.1 2-amino-4-hydroxy-6-hydroxymethyldihydropteridine diphosphokinase [Cryobacterium sp. TMT2-42-4]TFC63615.1 2-amino-4-hydroxy-6-hydroxymethyldihydropteridine diphosphokinase [Cryobacterium sp. TMT2-18-3]
MTDGTPALLALGSNLGDRMATLTAAIDALEREPGLELTGVSPVYESAAVKVGGVDDEAPRYLNLVVGIRYTGHPHTLLDAVNAIEKDHGRVRVERWGDRTLDIDIIVFGTASLHDERLTIPHQRAAERDFVLAPWLDLDPAAVLPGRGPVRALLGAINTTVQRYPALPSAGGNR